jgi:hypothetical protein
MQIDVSKAADHLGYRLVIRRNRGTQAVLKSLCVSELLSWSER